MIVLNSSNKSLISSLNISPSTNNLHYIVQFVDIASNGDYQGLDQIEGYISASGHTQLLGAPQAGILRRDIKYIKVHNDDSVTHAFELSVLNNGNKFDISDVQLKSEYTLYYNADGVIETRDPYGRILSADGLTTGSFLSLDDTPNTYAGSQGYNATVSGNQLIFVDPASQNSLSASYALTASYALNGGSVDFGFTSSYLLTSSYYTDSSSFEERINSLENFSSSLDATFATDAELTSLSSSLSITDSNLQSQIFSLTNETSSYVKNNQTSSMTVLSSSYALTASYALNGGGGSGASVQEVITQPGHTLYSGSAVAISASLYVPALAATGSDFSEVVGIVESVQGDQFTLVYSGKINLAGSYLEPIQPVAYFVSPTIPGQLTSISPNTAGKISKPVLVGTTGSFGLVTNYRGLEIQNNNPIYTKTDNFTLTGTDISNKYVTPSSTIIDTGSVILEIDGAPSQMINSDYIVSAGLVSWNGFGLDGLVESGEIIRLSYLTR
jgi:hypothetical protein